MKVEKVITNHKYSVDPETGESFVVEANISTETVKKVKNYEEFVQVYIAALAPLKELAVKSVAIKVLIYIWLKAHLMNEDKDLILYTNGAWIKNCAEYAGVDESSVRKAFPKLVEKGFLFKVDKGTYKVNPSYYFKGGLNTRQAIINNSLKIELEPNVEFDN